MNTRHTILDSPVGELTVVADGDALTGLYFPGHLRMPDPAGFGPREDAAFEETARQVAEYFTGGRTEFDLPLAPHGGAFELRVWELLRAIPYGETRSYGDLARELGDPALAQAVGSANGRNPISIVVPCHRVVGADGSLTGYAGGLDRKRYLLDLEAPVAARLF
jgi:methylated-DNA-[protein]-cysteine S-methyltransferase